MFVDPNRVDQEDLTTYCHNTCALPGGARQRHGVDNSTLGPEDNRPNDS
jgi:hypothetical protein